MGEVDDDAGKESGFRRTEKKPNPIELLRGVDEAGERRQSAPDDERRPDELPRAPQLDQHGSWNLEQKIADEKNPRPEAKHRIRKQVARHLQRGVAVLTRSR